MTDISTMLEIMSEWQPDVPVTEEMIQNQIDRKKKEQEQSVA